MPLRSLAGRREASIASVSSSHAVGVPLWLG